MTTGERMKSRRQELGISADTVADALGVSRATIFRYENGAIEKKPIDILPPLSRVLHCSPAYLMGWVDEPTDDGSAYFERKSRGGVGIIDNATPDRHIDETQESRGEVGSVDSSGATDPQFDRVLDAWAQLNEEGHERVAEHAELLVASGKYKKDGASRVVGDA